MHGNATFIEAAKLGDREMAEEALRRGADVDAAIDGWTALIWAAQEGHSEIVDLLLAAGANVNSAGPGGFTPLFQAVGESHVEIAERLILAGADVGHRCASAGGCTALHIAAAYGRLECIRMLLAYGADQNARSDDGETAYDTAIRCQETQAAALLH